MKPYYINENPDVQAVYDARKKAELNEGLTVNFVMNQHYKLMGLVNGENND